MRRRNRLGSSKVIRLVSSSGRRATSRGVGGTALIRGDEDPQVAVIASRRLGGAVARNRAKRRVRAALAPLVSRLAPGAAVVLAARKDALVMDFQDLAASLEEVLGRLEVLSA